MNREKPRKVKVLIGGDFYPGSADHINNNIWGDAYHDFQEANLSLINLEAPITTTNRAKRKTGPNLKIDPDIMMSLKKADINLVTLANNHIFDFGAIGLKDTMEYCSEYNIETVGAGKNLQEASKVYYKEVNGIKLAFINFAENEWGGARFNQPGFNPLDIIDNFRQIKVAKLQADHVILIVHGGSEHYPYPTPRMLKEYRFFADAGASIIISHHTHITSGYELYNGTPIFYGIGNLFFPNMFNFLKHWNEGMLIKLFIDKDKIDWRLIPYIQSLDSSSIQYIHGEEKKSFFNKILKINEVIANKDLLNQYWQERVDKFDLEYRMMGMIPISLIRRLINKFKLNKFVNLESQELLLLNLIRCETHRDILTHTLNNRYDKKEQSEGSNT